MDENYKKRQIQRDVWSFNSQKTSQEYFDETKQDQEGRIKSHVDHKQVKNKKEEGERKGEEHIIRKMIASPYSFLFDLP